MLLHPSTYCKSCACIFLSRSPVRTSFPKFDSFWRNKENGHNVHSFHLSSKFYLCSYAQAQYPQNFRGSFPMIASFNLPALFFLYPFFTKFNCSSLGFIAGNSNTSLMLALLVKNMVRRSIPNPQPPVGGKPCSSAVTKESSITIASSSPIELALAWSRNRWYCTTGLFNSV